MNSISGTITKYGEFLDSNMNKTKDKEYTWILCDTTELALEKEDFGMKTVVKIDGEDKECYITQNNSFNGGYRASENKAKFCDYVRSVLKKNNNIQSILINNGTQYIIMIGKVDSSFNYDCNEIDLKQQKHL